MASPRISLHCSRLRLLVMMIEPRLERGGSEEEVGGLAFEREIADLIDDEQLVALEPTQLALELVAACAGSSLEAPFLGGRDGGLGRPADRAGSPVARGT
jgi:methyl coenzyme M reductase alpha subunit